MTSPRPVLVSDEMGRFARIGNRLALDFANTVHARRQNADAIQTAGDIFDFLQVCAAAPDQRLADYRKSAKSDTVAQAELIDRAIKLRMSLRAWLEAGRPPPGDRSPLIREINVILDANTSKLVLRQGGQRWVLDQMATSRSLLSALAPVARSAAELIVEGPGAPIRKCGNPKCPMYFYDTSRTGKRRWCAMESCGNHAKVRSFLKRRDEMRASL